MRPGLPGPVQPPSVSWTGRRPGAGRGRSRRPAPRLKRRRRRQLPAAACALPRRPSARHSGQGTPAVLPGKAVNRSVCHSPSMRRTIKHGRARFFQGHLQRADRQKPFQGGQLGGRVVAVDSPGPNFFGRDGRVTQIRRRPGWSPGGPVWAGVFAGQRLTGQPPGLLRGCEIWQDWTGTRRILFWR